MHSPKYLYKSEDSLKIYEFKSEGQRELFRGWQSISKLVRKIFEVMKKIEQLNNSKVPVIVFDKKLEQFRNKILFPEKLAKANDILAKVGLPKK